MPAGTADLAAEELTSYGATDVKVSRGGVACAGTLEHAYRACLWSRVANRVLLPIANFPAPTPEALYEGVHAVPWHEHLAADGTLAVDCTTSRSAITSVTCSTAARSSCAAAIATCCAELDSLVSR